MQFDSENPADSISLKDLATKESEEMGKTELQKDTLSVMEIPAVENKEVVKNQPKEVLKRGTRNKKVRQ